MKKIKSPELLIQSIISDLELRGYSANTIRKHKMVFSRLQWYCKSANVTEYSEAVGQQFVEYVRQCNSTMNVSTLYKYTGCIKRLNCALSNIEWRQCSSPKRHYAKSCYDSLVNEYESYLIRAGKLKKFVRSSVLIIADFLAFAENYGCTQIRNFSAEIVLAGFERATCKTRFRQALCAFFNMCTIYTQAFSGMR